MPSGTLIITVLAGLAALLFGRQLFWLFVGIVGFIVSFNLVPQYLTGQPEWMILLISLGAGLLGALLAVFLQYVAVGIAGFLAGGYAVFVILRLLDAPGSGWFLWTLIILGGVLGAVLVLMLYDWALIILSASVGATTLVQLADLSPLLTFLLFFGLLIVGIAFQAAMLRRSGAPVRRTIIRRRTRVIEES